MKLKMFMLKTARFVDKYEERKFFRIMMNKDYINLNHFRNQRTDILKIKRVSK